jgi:polyferredoxin
VALFLRSDIDVNVSPVRNPTFVTLSDGTIRNSYDLRLRNKTGEDSYFSIAVTSESDIVLRIEGTEDALVRVPANETFQQRIFLEASPGSEAATEDRTDVRLWIADTEGKDRVSHDTVFNGKDDD